MEERNGFASQAPLLIIAGVGLFLMSWALDGWFETGAIAGMVAGLLLFVAGLLLQPQATLVFLRDFWIVILFLALLVGVILVPGSWIESVPGLGVLPDWALRVVLLIILQGIAFVVWSALRDRSAGPGRRTAVAANVTLLVEVGVALLVVANVLGAGPLTRWIGSWDATETNLFSLGDRTERLLASLGDREGTVYAVYIEFGSSGGLGRRALDFLRKYGDESTHVVVKDFNGITDQADVERYFRDLGVTKLEVGGQDTVVFLYRRPGQDVPNRKDVAVSPGAFVETSQLGQTKFRAEQIFTSAIQDVVLPKKKVYLLKGHGEHPFSGSAADSLGPAVDLLKKLSLDVDSVNLGQRGVMPDDADLVVVAGPRTPFLPAEVDLLTKWLDAGGSMIAMFDPDARLLQPGEERRSPVLDEYLKSLGIEVKTDYLCMDYEVTVGQTRYNVAPTSILLTAEYGYHPIVDDLKEQEIAARFLEACPVLKVEDDGEKDVTVTDLVYLHRSPPGFADQQTYAAALFPNRNIEVPRPDRDLALTHRLPLAVAAEKAREGEASAGEEKDRARRTRVVVFGDSEFATKLGISPEGAYYAPGNPTLLTNAVSWAIGREQLLSIEPKTLESDRVALNDRQEGLIFAVSIIVLPVLVLCFAIGVWWRRR